MPDFIFQGGECNVELIGNKVYELPTDCFQLLNMLTSREKRKNRRAENAQMLENSYSKGMDVQPPKFLTWRQEEFWNLMKKNTVTL